MIDKNPEDFTFEDWQELYKKDPEKFEEMRKKAIDNLINSASDKNRESLLHFQWKIDMERKKCKNPLQACIKINEMLINHLYSEDGLFSALEKLSSKVTSEEKKPKKAKVIPFPKKDEKSY